jgi:hypothetical protein
VSNVSLNFFLHSFRHSEWYERQLCLLKDTYEDVISKPAGGLDSTVHKRLVKLRDEFSHQPDQSFAVYIERVSIEIPQLKPKDILVTHLELKINVLGSL